MTASPALCGVPGGAAFAGGARRWSAGRSPRGGVRGKAARVPADTAGLWPPRAAPASRASPRPRPPRPAPGPGGPRRPARCEGVPVVSGTMPHRPGPGPPAPGPGHGRDCPARRRRRGTREPPPPAGRASPKRNAPMLHRPGRESQIINPQALPVPRAGHASTSSTASTARRSGGGINAVDPAYAVVGAPRGYRIHHVSHIHRLIAPGRRIRNRPRHSRPASTAPASRQPSSRTATPREAAGLRPRNGRCESGDRWCDHPGRRTCGYLPSLPRAPVR